MMQGQQGSPSNAIAEKNHKQLKLIQERFWDFESFPLCVPLQHVLPFYSTPSLQVMGNKKYTGKMRHCQDSQKNDVSKKGTHRFWVMLCPKGQMDETVMENASKFLWEEFRMEPEERKHIVDILPECHVILVYQFSPNREKFPGLLLGVSAFRTFDSGVFIGYNAVYSYPWDLKIFGSNKSKIDGVQVELESFRNAGINRLMVCLAQKFQKISLNNDVTDAYLQAGDDKPAKLAWKSTKFEVIGHKQPSVALLPEDMRGDILWSFADTPKTQPLHHFVLMKLSEDVEKPPHPRFLPKPPEKETLNVIKAGGTACALGDFCDVRGHDLTKRFGCVLCRKFVHPQCCYEMNQEEDSYLAKVESSPFGDGMPKQKVVCHNCCENKHTRGSSCIESKVGGHCTHQTLRIHIHHQCIGCRGLIHPLCAISYAPLHAVDLGESLKKPSWKNQPICKNCFVKHKFKPSIVELNEIKDEPEWLFPHLKKVLLSSTHTFTLLSSRHPVPEHLKANAKDLDEFLGLGIEDVVKNFPLSFMTIKAQLFSISFDDIHSFGKKRILSPRIVDLLCYLVIPNMLNPYRLIVD